MQAHDIETHFFVKKLLHTHPAIELTEAATGGVLWKKVNLEISPNSQENTCSRLWHCEFCEISKKTFFTERPCSTTSKLMYYKPINHLNLGQI